MSEEMHYFRPVEGRVCRRYGGDSFIGATRSPKGFQINTDVVVAITDRELTPYRKDYASYIRHGDLKRSNQKEYDAYQAARTKRTADAKAKRKADQKKADAATEKAAKKAKDAADNSNNAGDESSDESGDSATRK